MTFTVAILGRPNVGKSTLFNRLVGQKIAIVDDTPGVTRDRREGEARLGELRFRLFDTAGLDDAAKGSLAQRMSAQSMDAAKLADVILLVMDARAGVTPTDREFAQRVRKLGKPVLLVGNKAESRAALRVSAKPTVWASVSPSRFRLSTPKALMACTRPSRPTRKRKTAKTKTMKRKPRVTRPKRRSAR